MSSDESSDSSASSKSQGIAVDPKTKAVLDHKGYVVLMKISEGNFGEVFKAENRKRHEVNAVKVMHLDRVKKKGLNQVFLKREIEALIAVKHPNVLKVNDIFQSGGRLYIFMEFAPNGTLQKRVDNAPNKYLPEAMAKHWFRQCVKALYCMHNQHKMAHRDIKLDNVLLDPKDNAKLSDFGFARSFDFDNEQLSTTFCGTPPYYAPEILAKRPYNPMVYDIWSMGVMLFAMLHGNLPFDFNDFKKNRQQLLMQMQKRKYSRNRKAEKDLSKEVKDLINRIFTFDADDRPNINAVSKHPWLRR